MIEVIDLGMCFDNVVRAFEIECVEQGFIEGYPYWDSVCIMRKKNLGSKPCQTCVSLMACRLEIIPFHS